MNPKNLNKTILIASFVGCLIIRLAGDSLLFIIDKLDTNTALIWRVLTSLILLLPPYYLLFRDLPQKITKFSLHSEEVYFSQLRRLSLLSFTLFIIYLVFHYLKLSIQIKDDLFVLILSECLAIFSVIIALYFYYFLWLWLLSRRHRKTILYLVILRNGLFYFVIVELLLTIFPNLDKPVVSVISTLMGVFIGIIMLLVSRKNQWLALLPKPEKIRLLWISLFLILLSSFIGYSIYLKETIIGVSLKTFTPGAFSFVLVISGFTILYFFRIFITVLTSIPTSYIVERKTRELSSLTELNKVVSETIDLKLLLDTVVRLALKSTRSLAGWIELFNIGEKTTLNAMENVSEEQINILDKSSVLENIFRTIEKPLLVNSIFEDKQIASLNWSAIPRARALLAVPLHSGGEKIGILCVLCTDEYGFEDDDVKLLTAFSDNVSVAIENARLVKDSIEKEKYRQELILARQMSQKLLPRHLPVIKNYSIAAFSIPAEQVGGDYYDIVTLKNAKSCIIIADVSGKGISAAFYMAQLKGVVIALARESSGPAELLRRVNSTLFKSMDKQMYITISAIVINDSEGNITFARAGHMPGLFKNNGIVNEIIPRGIGVGLANALKFDENIEEIQLNFKENDIFLLFTDGLNELKNIKGDDLGIQPINNILESINSENMEVVQSKIQNLIDAFSEGGVISDDITVVLLKYSGNSN